jgi:Ca2+/H+ antiporter
VIALAVLVLSSDWFVGAAEKIGLSLGWPPFVVGVIIIGIGTSLPELMSSIMAVVQEQNQIVAGNVFGSNITNIFLIAGLAGVLGKSFEDPFRLHEGRRYLPHRLHSPGRLFGNGRNLPLDGRNIGHSDAGLLHPQQHEA